MKTRDIAMEIDDLATALMERARQIGGLSSACDSCGDIFPEALAGETNGHCPACWLDLKYGYATASVSDVLERNVCHAAVREMYHRSMPEGQRSAKRHTDGG